ncbi:MAG: hypothetical protein ACYDCO_25495 [Armatimonadota bacterium]
MLLVSGATTTMNQYKGNPHLGRLVVPDSHNKPEIVSGWHWAADNGAFKGFNEEAFLRMLTAFYYQPGNLFVTAPDAVKQTPDGPVGDAEETDRLFALWQPRLAEWGWNVAYVLQDGATLESVPWCQFNTLFIGGSTSFKLASRPFINEAKRRGYWVHVGRVNTRERLWWALRSGADSVDGTCFSRYPKAHLPWALEWIDRLEHSNHDMPAIATGKPYRLHTAEGELFTK